jgi:cation diffusion facilitator CzcD-associated flavoprotein CzcO
MQSRGQVSLARTSAGPKHETSVDLLIVGAGFSGAVLAERFARVLGKRSLVIDRQAHIAGNAYDGFDAAGVRIQKYGPHYFRTNSDRVRDYLSQFTEWQPVEYNSISIIEALALISEISGKQTQYEYTDRHRKGDHICYVSDLTKIRAHYPKWAITKDLRRTFEEIFNAWRGRCVTNSW